MWEIFCNFARKLSAKVKNSTQKSEIMDKIKDISIRNYKSLGAVEIKDCKTFNLFIGRPNVGKSNIIEALSLFALPYLAPMKKSMDSIFRIERASALFTNGQVGNPIVIEAGGYRMELGYENPSTVRMTSVAHGETKNLSIADLKVKKGIEGYPVFKPYSYESHANADLHTQVDMPFLCPWDGNNMMQVIQQNEGIKQSFVEMLREYGLQLTFDMARQEVRVLKPMDDTSSFILPYMALADSIKRLMFFNAAVDSNKESVLLFEELEAHAYPPYITKICQTIIENPSNQYFITTHSPYVVTEFLQEKDIDLAIHLVDYREGKTIVKTLTEEEQSEVYDYGIDLFFNTEAFLS